MKRLHELLFLTLLLFTGCHESGKQAAEPAAHFMAVADTAYNTACSYLTRNARGVPVMSWIQQNKEGEARVYYAVFSDSSGRFGSPRAIPASVGVELHGENMPKLVFPENGSMLLIFGIKNPRPGNPYTGAVRYTWSRDGGRHWTPARPLIADTMQSYDQRYFDPALLPNGKVGLVWLSDSRPEGSRLCFAQSEGREGFSPVKVLGRHTCQCCRTDLMVDDSGIIHVAWRNIFQDSIRDMAYCYSKDTGKTFSGPVRISPDNWVVDGCPHTGPSMVKNKSGLHFSWFTMGGGGGVYYCHTRGGGHTFSGREVVSGLSSARHPQMAVMPDQDIAIVWDEGVKDGPGFGQRIGLQLRGPDGLLLNTTYLTSKDRDATFPQILTLDERAVLISYTERKGMRRQVRYGRIRL